MRCHVYEDTPCVGVEEGIDCGGDENLESLS